MEGCTEAKETINTIISKLYRKADYDLSRAQRGILFLDGMDKIGAGLNLSEPAKKQVLK
jgi:ATP-dependent protease Clp ATPase subunit